MTGTKLQQATTHKFGPYEFVPAQLELREGAARKALTPALNRLLLLFVTNPGELVTREQIAEALWESQGTVDIVAGTNTAIRRLRTLIGDSNGHGTYIQTVVGAGYRFVAHVQQDETAAVITESRVSDPASSAAVSESPMAASVPERRRPTPQALPVSAYPKVRIRRWMVAAALIGVFAILGAFVWRQRSRALVSQLATPPAPARFKAVTFNDSDDRVTAAAISPGGEMIAYSDRSGISVVWPDSSSVRLLASPPQFEPSRIDWYPDSKRLAVSGTFKNASTSQTWQISLDGSAPRLLADDSAAATISPDGKSMAYIWRQGTEIALANADGSGPRKLTAAGERQTYRFLLWSRSGRYLVDEISSEGLAAEPSAPVVRSSAPLSELEAEQRWNYETLDVRSGRMLVREENIHFDSGYLLPDGRLFYPDSTVSRMESSTRLMMVQTDPLEGRFLGPPVMVQQTAGDRATGLSSSLDGVRAALVISRSTADTFVGTLRRPAPGIDKVTQITHHSFESYPHAWTPNDDAVLLENNNLGKDAIFEQRLDSSPPKLIARLPNDAAMAEFTADGKWILFIELIGHPNRVDALFRVPAEGGIPEQVQATGEIEEFHCPVFGGSCVLREEIDKKYLAYYALDPIKGMGRELARTAWEPALLGEWSLSPDGGTVAVARHDSLHPSIRLIDLKTTPVKISEIPVAGMGALLGVTWDVKARGFFVESKTETDYRLLYVGRTGEVKTVRSSLTPIWAAPSHDGTKVAFPETNFRSNVLLLSFSRQ